MFVQEILKVDFVTERDYFIIKIYYLFSTRYIEKKYFDKKFWCQISFRKIV